MVEGCRETAHTTTSISTYDVAQEHLDLVEVQDCYIESTCNLTPASPVCPNLDETCTGETTAVYPSGFPR